MCVRLGAASCDSDADDHTLQVKLRLYPLYRLRKIALSRHGCVPASVNADRKRPYRRLFIGADDAELLGIDARFKQPICRIEKIVAVILDVEADKA